jgi:glycosyltransferase involved in cell wall biosynthesis
METTNTVILTVHNKEKTVGTILDGILSNSSNFTTTVVVVLDGCTDDSKRVVEESIKARTDRRIALRLIETNDVWETRANNAGMRLAETDYVTIIQDDMLIKHPAWDHALLDVFSSRELFAVSGRASHDFSLRNGQFAPENLSGREFPLGIRSLLGRAVGRFMLKLRPFWIYRFWGPVAVALAVNRGPLMLRRDLLLQLGYLDEAFAPFELDDLDLCCRAFKTWGLKSASRPLYYKEIGGSKATSSISSEMSERCIRKNTALIKDRHEGLAVR